MIWVLVYLLGVIIAGIWEYYEGKSQCLNVTLRDIFLFATICLFSWFTMLIMTVAWVNDNWNRVVWKM